VRVTIAVVILVACAQHQGNAATSEGAIFQFFNSLPDGLRSFFQLLYVLGTLWAVGLVVAAACLAERGVSTTTSKPSILQVPQATLSHPASAYMLSAARRSAAVAAEPRRLPIPSICSVARNKA